MNLTADSLRCAGTAQFGDVHPGAEVVVHDDRGQAIARGPLRPEHGAAVPPRCDYSFTIEGLPIAASYSFRVGRHDAGTLSAEQLARAGWRVDLTIGP